MYLSAFELFRIGPGPSSSATVGPQRAALRFVHDLAADGLVPATARVEAELYGGLAFAVREQSTDRAIVAGLCGESPERCDATSLAEGSARVEVEGTLLLGGRHRVAHIPERDLRFVVNHSVAFDGNAIRFIARDAGGEPVASRVYYSTGNGAGVFTWPDGGTTMFRGEKNTNWECGHRVPSLSAGRAPSSRAASSTTSAHTRTC